jgi:phage/plasmid-associated DNA primase
LKDQVVDAAEQVKETVVDAAAKVKEVVTGDKEL